MRSAEFVRPACEVLNRFVSRLNSNDTNSALRIPHFLKPDFLLLHVRRTSRLLPLVFVFVEVHVKT